MSLPNVALRVLAGPGLLLGIQLILGKDPSLPQNFIPIIILFIMQVWNVVSTSNSKLTGQAATSIKSLKFIQGEAFDITPGKVVVLEFWATWCGPCKSSIPHVSKLYEAYKNKGVVFVGISNEAESVVKTFVEKMGHSFSYPVAIDSSASVSTAYPHRGIPFAVVVGKDGNIAWSGHPMDKMEDAIKAALSGAGHEAKNGVKKAN